MASRNARVTLDSPLSDIPDVGKRSEAKLLDAEIENARDILDAGHSGLLDAGICKSRAYVLLARASAIKEGYHNATSNQRSRLVTDGGR